MKLKPELVWIKHNEHKPADIKTSNDLVAQDTYYRPAFHIAPPNGLLNDPNGLLFKDKVHHIHYQWSPLQPYHGFKHWIYLTTKDFVTYQDHGVSITPEHPKEAWGAFSGSAYDFGNQVKIYYTGNLEDGQGNILEEVQIAADLVDHKVVNKTVVVESDFENFTEHTRDPKIFEYEGKKYMIFGVQCQDDKRGGLAFYELISPTEFKYLTTLKSGLGNDYGYMWECPNLDLLEDKYLFMMSAEGWFKDDNKYELNCSRNVVYTAIKNLDLKNGKLNEEFELKTMDSGHDFYAPQTYRANDKLVMFGWFGNVGVQYPTDEYSWHSMMTIPRELSWAKNNLVQKPYSEFSKNVLTNTQVLDTKTITNQQVLHLKFELEGNLEIKLSNDLDESVTINFSKTEISFNRENQSEKVDWDYETTRHALRKFDKQTVEIFLDKSALEMFADNYQTIFTSRFFIKDWNKIEFSKNLKVEVSDVKHLELKG